MKIPRKKLNARQKALKAEKRNKKRLIKEADRNWHKAVLEKYGNTCFFDGVEKQAKEHKKYTEYAHHFFGKRLYPALRHVTENGVPICWACHFRLEQIDKTMATDIRAKRGEKWYQNLMIKELD